MTFVLAFFALPLTGLSGALVGVLRPPPSAFNCFSALVLAVSFSAQRLAISSLEFIGCPLPFTSDLDSHLDTAEHILVSALVVYSELQDVSVLVISPCSSALAIYTHIKHSRP